MSVNNPPARFGQAQLSAGTRLSGIYEIDRLIGTGGMGEIYSAHLIETGDQVAIKVLLPEFCENAAALTLFRKEASALHHVHNDAVVRYFVFTVDPVLGRPYLAMEFVDGRSLSDMLQSDGPLTFEATCSLSRRLASGLQSAHECGVIHRDVSPDNVIVPSGDVAHAKIIDFGIARSTQHGTVIGSGFAGKFNYVSPEQLGLFGGDVTAKSDVYSLGLVLVHTLAGQPIDMGGTQLDVIEKRRKVPDLGGIDMRIRPLLEKMLQPDPAKRLESMAAVAAWSLPGVPAPRQNTNAERSAATNTAPAGHQRFWTQGAAALALIGVLGTAGAYYYYGTQAPVLAPARPPKLDDGISPNSVISAAPSHAEKIRHYVDQYNGGDCFFVSAVAVSDSAAALEGFGASTKAFEKLDGDFHRTLGFEADIGVRQVTEQQCPAISFLGRLRNERARAPHLDIDKEHLRNGEVLGGMVDRFGDRNIDLVLVSDGGTVQNLSQLLKPGTDAKTFKIGMQRTEGGADRQPQLLMAIATVSPLASLRPGRAASANEFFSNVLNEATRAGQPLGATARYFMLER
jgi:serine/threonine protein kinase